MRHPFESSFSRRSRRRAAGAVLVAVLVSSALAPAMARAAEEPAATAAKQDLSPERRASIAAARAAFEALPQDFREVTRDRLDDVARRLEACRADLDAIVRSGEIGANCDVPYMLARLNTSMSARLRAEWATKERLPQEEIERRAQEFHAGNVVLCDRALACAGEGAETRELRARIYDLRGDILFQMRTFDAALASYLRALETLPEYSGCGNTVVGAGRCHIELRQWREGIEWIDRAIRERYRDSSLPIFYEVKWNLLEIAGDIEGMIEWCRQVQRVFPLRQLRDGMSRVESDGYRRYLGFSGFRLGYALFAKGDFGAAADAFMEHIAAMEKLRAELDKEKKALPQELAIYEQRSRDNLDVLRDRVGEPPPMDLELGSHWVTPRQTTFAASTGKAVALLFRGEGDVRSAGFLQNLDRHLAKDRGNKEFAVIHYLKGAQNVLDQMEKVADELARLDISDASVGMDPDASGKQIFRAFGAMVGTATFMIYDRGGRLAWWMQDPREMDSRLCIRIWDRLAGE